MWYSQELLRDYKDRKVKKASVFHLITILQRKREIQARLELVYKRLSMQRHIFFIYDASYLNFVIFFFSNIFSFILSVCCWCILEEVGVSVAFGPDNNQSSHKY